MITKLFGKFLLTCDHPDGCKNLLRIKSPDEAERKITEGRWLAFSITPKGKPEVGVKAEAVKLVFLCPHCQSKIPNMTQAQYLKMRESAHTIKESGNAS